MPNREYYARRKGLGAGTEITFSMLKRIFLNTFVQLRKDDYLQQALGYHCIDDGDVPGTWGADHEAFVLSVLRMDGLWPIESNIENWEEPELFTMIEFLYDHVSAPDEGRYHSFANCGWHGTTWNQEKGRQRYREEMNGILKDYEPGFVLSEKGEVLQLAPTGLDTLVDEMAVSGDADNIDNRVQGAISSFRKHNASLNDKKEAVRTLGDVLEFLKKNGKALPKPDDSSLFQILNKFDIRHHRPDQSANYSREEFYPWIFYTLLASIDLLVRLSFGAGQPAVQVSR